MILSIMVIGSTAIASPVISEQQYCTAVFQSYLDGCVGVFMGAQLTDEQIKMIVSDCISKDKAYTRKTKGCESVKFDSEK